jgi:hypothetical protein
MIVKFLLCCEIEIDDPPAWIELSGSITGSSVVAARAQAIAQRKLDAFREAVRPNDYGISLYRCEGELLDDYLKERS